VKTEKLEQLAPSHLPLDVQQQEQGGRKGLPASAFLFEMSTICKAPQWVKGQKE
jgi:hypothetical protein